MEFCAKLQKPDAMIHAELKSAYFFLGFFLEFSTYNAALAFRVWTEFLLVVGATLYDFKEKSWHGAVKNDKVLATFILAFGMLH